MAAGTNTAPLPPSVEEAYKRKCIELKRRMTEVEESNDAFRLRKVRLTRGIRKMRLERAYLLETLGKRMKKNGSVRDGLQGVYDEDSEDSSEGPPTPHEKPLRSKRSHRRPLASPPPTIDYQMPHSQSYQSNYSPHTHMHHERRSYPQQAIPHTNGHPQQAYTTTFPVNPAPPQHTEPPIHTHPMLSPIPPAPAFHMFYEQKFLSQMHKFNIKDDKELHALARKEWQEATEGTRQLYLMQENQQRNRYEAQMAHLKEQEGLNDRHMGREEPRYEEATRYDSCQDLDSRRGERIEEERNAFEVEKERAERERAEVEAAEKEGTERNRADEDVEMRGSGGGGGFTSINHG